MLPPDVLMKIECAADAEPPGIIKERMCGIYERALVCGLNGKPLFSGRGSEHVFLRMGQNYKGAAPMDAVSELLPNADTHIKTVRGDGLSVTLSLFDPEYLGLAKVERHSGEPKELLDFIIRSALGNRIDPELPLFIGAGAGKDEGEARLMALYALSRPMDKANPVSAVKRLEIRAYSKINRLARDEGGGTSVLAVHIELGENPGYRALIFAPPELRRAKQTL